MRYLSVCSGIEAASAAWKPLGWECVGVSEIDAFPSAALAHHHPEVCNFGDFTTIQKQDIDGTVDLLVGGTPCQSFSVAGLRRGMDDERGNLALQFVELAFRLGVRIVVWENVPGVFSSTGGRDFASFLSGLAGRNIPVPKNGWRNSGIIEQAEGFFGIAWRVLDAQYVRVESHPRAVPQRRRRVFVVGCLGDWRRAAAVLFERESMRRNTPPRREAGKGTAAGFEVGPSGGRESGTSPTLDTRCKDGAIRNQVGAIVGVSNALCSRDYKGARPEANQGAPLIPVAHAMHVRRLTPRECERLQGFTDDYTLVPYRGKPAADGPRYKALGNSMAVNCMFYIGQRIQMVDNTFHAEEGAD